MKTFRIAYVCDWDANDPNAMSGVAFYIRKAFIDAGHEVIDIFPISRALLPTVALLLAAPRAYIDRLRGYYTSPRRTHAYITASARVLQAALRRAGPVDFIVGQSSLSVAGAGPDIGVPIVLVADQTFDQYVTTYLSKPSQAFLRAGREIERCVAASARHIVYPSAWARTAFATTLPEFAHKAKVVPWGGNLRDDPDPAEVEGWIAARTASPRLSLTFIGRDWRRKGGDTVVEAFDLLRRRRLAVHLTIIGTPIDITAPGVTVIPFLNKQTQDGWRRFVEIMARTTFLFVPSIAEAYGHAFCEAGAFGVPSVTRDVGGISAIVEHNVDGLCLPRETDPATFADAIVACHADSDRYRAVSQRIFLKYRQTHSWRAFARTVCATVAER